MIFLHVIIPFIAYVMNRDKTMLLGLLLGQLVDVDHFLYARIFHAQWFLLLAVGIAFILLARREQSKYKLTFWVAIGVILHMLLDSIQRLTGVCI